MTPAPGTRIVQIVDGPRPERLFKVLSADGRAFHGGKGKWALPTLEGPGAWMPPITDIHPCQRGYHLCREQDLFAWLGPMICLAEYRGDRKDCPDKVVVSEARILEVVPTWTEETARLFAADCAEGVLQWYEAKYPQDPRPRKAILAARQYALGLLHAAARDAASEDAWAAAREAATGAATVAAGAAARAAVGAAAWATVGPPAWATATGAAWAAARKRRTEQLMEMLFAAS